MTVKELIARSKAAQAEFAFATQEQADAAAKAICKVVYDNAEKLGPMAAEESRMGSEQDKIAKCRNKSALIWESLKGKKSCDIINRIEERRMIEVAKPVGVVASIIWVYLYNGQISPIVKGLESIGIHVDFFANNVVLGSMANITTWTFTGYNMLIFLAALQAIPHDLYEAARIDGANGFQVAMKIKLPNVRGAALLAMLLSIVGTIQLFNEPQIMSTADPGISKAYTPMMMAMNTSQGTLTPSGDGPASAIAIVMALIAGLLAVVYTLAERKVNE